MGSPLSRSGLFQLIVRGATEKLRIVEVYDGDHQMAQAADPGCPHRAGTLAEFSPDDDADERSHCGVSLPARPGDIGLGDPFRFLFVTIERVLPLDRTRLLVINDNTFPFSTGRNPGRPDGTEFIIVRLQPAGW